MVEDEQSLDKAAGDDVAPDHLCAKSNRPLSPKGGLQGPGIPKTCIYIYIHMYIDIYIYIYIYIYRDVYIYIERETTGQDV